MTTPITKQSKKGAKPAASAPAAAEAPPLRTWCCGTPITDPHTPGCAYEPREDNPVDYTGPVDVVDPVQTQEPPPPPTEVPAAAPRAYGFNKAGEHDIELPSGGFVRYRKLNKGNLLQLNLIEVMDGFTPELLADIGGEDAQAAEGAALRALVDPKSNAKIFGPIDRVIAAAVVAPKVVLDEPSTDTQINVAEIELEDKVAIFMAAVGEQLEALKSIRQQPTSGV
ncbi:hypothetical protein EV580_1312 [Mycobacterium sp. BK086]|uniref:DUF7391 family protein n=1 Tax=Mycobacterium sp. BK086 TaxID=2512165 RepID=UPI00105DC854|nr:hypothetical protein [Mycobacterium sp. BK086]TDO18130.1 hypothetical protein EV580_1312 [Mycobacterium sp. BK086]